MALSAELQARYSSETDVDWWQGIVLSHPNMTTVYICNDTQARQAAVDGTVRTFQAVPFKILRPSRSAEGRQDLRLQMCAIGAEAARFVAQALTDPTQPITLQYGEWLKSTTTQQMDPLLSLNLTDIVIGEQSVEATATATDTLNRPFPSVLYTVETFPGLDRR
jgi:hypothetical protein